jgi:hypothetical protein
MCNPYISTKFFTEWHNNDIKRCVELYTRWKYAVWVLRMCVGEAATISLNVSLLMLDGEEVIQRGLQSTLTKCCWKGKSALDWIGLEPETSDTAFPLGREASYGSLGRKSRYSELHFLSVPRRKCSDVLVCGTQEALTLVVILKNGCNHWSWVRTWIEFVYWC